MLRHCISFLHFYLVNKFATKKTPLQVPFLFVMFEEDLSLEDKLLNDLT
jgi:hypothetical protein